MRRPTTGPICSPVALLALLLLAGPATAQSFSRSAGVGESPGSGPSVFIEHGGAGGVLMGDERGFHGLVHVLGGGEFGVGFEMTYFFQQRELDELFHLSRAFVSVQFVEFWPGAGLTLEAGVGFGEHLVGDDTFTELSVGARAAFPLFFDGNGFPYWRVDAGYNFGPVHRPLSNFLFRATTTVFPLDDIRELGLEAGWMFGEDRNTPWHVFYVGIAWGAAVGRL